MNIEICMTLTGSAVVLFYLLLKPLKGKYIKAEYYQYVLRTASVLYILPFQMVKYPARNILKLLNLAYADTGVYYYKNLEYKYINKAFYYSETFRKKAELIIWSIAAGIFLLAVIYIYIKFMKAANLMEPIRAPKVVQIVSDVKKEIGLNRRVSVFYSSKLKGTFTTGIFTPVIIIRQDDMLSDNLEIIVKHELIHVKNHDSLFYFVTLLAVAVNWYNPFVHYLFLEVRHLNEQVCDSKVINGMDKNARNVYGELIVEKAEDEGKKVRIMLLRLRSRSSKLLEERIKLIKNYKGSDKKSKSRTIIFMVAALVCVFMASSFSVLAYEEPAEVSAPYVESHEVTDFEFTVENVAGTYFDSDISVFESGNKIFIDENGKTYPIYDEASLKKRCSHEWQNGIASDHSEDDSECVVKVYNAQRCGKCNAISLETLVSETIYIACPH